MSKEISLIDYDKEIEAISKYEHYSAGFHNTFGDIRSLHVRFTPLNRILHKYFKKTDRKKYFHLDFANLKKILPLP